ncbi:MAG TPA: hypothetical protein VMH32_16900 [Burkholderiales bacterium]|nr:hypothetical protein [Burkholderiales bacterium]
MSPLAIASIVFALVLVSGFLGLLLRGLLPEHHLSDDSMGAVKLGTSLISTLAALVLGLLIASAKGYYDKIGEEVTQTAVKVVLLDRALAEYGPETKDLRGTLRNAFAAIAQVVFSDEGSLAGKVDSSERQKRFEGFQRKLHDLTPRTDVQHALQARALDLTSDLEQMRWLVIEQPDASISTPLLVVLVLWLAVIFLGFGLVSAKNATVIIVFVLAALSVAGSVFLIEEMDRPFAGFMRISSAPLQNALSHLGE